MDTMREHTTDIEFTTDGIPELILRGHSGDVQVRGEDRQTIAVHIDTPSRAYDFAGEPVGTSQSGNQVTVDVTTNHVTLHSDLMVRVPIGCQVLVKTISGDIAVEGTGAGVDLTTVNGDVRVEDVEGVLKLHSVSGDFRVERARGVLQLQTTNGDVVVLGSALQRFNCHTVSGDLSIESPLREGEHYFAKTMNGDVRLHVPPATGATIQVRTLHGEFHSDLPTEVINRSKRNWQGRINGGGAYLEVETLNGDVRISSSESDVQFGTDLDSEPIAPAVPTPPVPPVPPMYSDAPSWSAGGAGREWDDGNEEVDAPSEIESVAAPTGSSHSEGTSSDAIDILAQLERGELSVEDAMQALDDLR